MNSYALSGNGPQFCRVSMKLPNCNQPTPDPPTLGRVEIGRANHPQPIAG